MALDPLPIGQRLVDEELLKLERDIQIGRSIQLGFLPASLPQPTGWEIAARFQPAREVAGDFYDAFEMTNGRRLGFLVADVCDKGVGAALFMALFRTLIRSNAQQNTSLGWMDPKASSVTESSDWLRGDPSQRRQSLPSIGTGALMHAVSGTNDYIADNHMDQGYFATVFMGVLDPTNGALIYINGGHNPPLLLRADGTIEQLKPTGPAVGMFPGAKFTIAQARLRPGDTLYAYTDGVTDARSPAEEFWGMERIRQHLVGDVASAEALVAGIMDDLNTHIGSAAQFDDITMMALRRRNLTELEPTP
jgi:sigma-B regulation protein RsbU (phosphoserine phosphatase)